MEEIHRKTEVRGACVPAFSFLDLVPTLYLDCTGHFPVSCQHRRYEAGGSTSKGEEEEGTVVCH